MNRDDVIRMAREAGLIYWTHNRWWSDAGEPGDELTRFAALVAAAEREACAKVCSDINREYDGEEVSAGWIAEAIRARGQA